MVVSPPQQNESLMGRYNYNQLISFLGIFFFGGGDSKENRLGHFSGDGLQFERVTTLLFMSMTVIFPCKHISTFKS